MNPTMQEKMPPMYMETIHLGERIKQQSSICQAGCPMLSSKLNLSEGKSGEIAYTSYTAMLSVQSDEYESLKEYQQANIMN